MIIVSSKASLYQVPAKYRYKTEIVPHGIERIPKESFKNVNRYEETPFIYYCGRLVPYKGVELLVKAFHQYLKAGDVNLNLLIVGDGPELPLLNRYILQNKLENRIKLLGKLDRTENLSLMHRSLFCVFPALNEAFGNVNLEAMALGKTIIVSDSGGPADIVEDGIDGFKIKTRSIDDYVSNLAEKIKLLHLNDEMRERMAASATKKALNEFSYSAIADKVNALYDKICND
jgi:glycosyltransferase involved in cell wall biosynthesis